MFTCLATLFSTQNRSSDLVLLLPQLFASKKKYAALSFLLFHLFPSLVGAEDKGCDV